MKIMSTATKVAPQKITATEAVAKLDPIPEQDQADPFESQKTAVQKALRLSFIIYDPLDYLKPRMEQAGYEHVRPINCTPAGAQGMCLIKDKTAYIVFRGSASAWDWVMDFMIIPFYWPLRHCGFATAWFSLRKQVRSWLDEVNGTYDNLIICGHSLGGGMAHLAAMDLAQDYSIGNVVTFGAPKACFLGTAKRYNETKIYGRDEKETLEHVTFCVINQRDIVAKVPFEIIGYRDVGQIVYIDFKQNVHYGSDAWKARSDDSMMDADFLLNFMEEEKISGLGAHSSPTEKFYHNMRVALAWLGKVSPPLKSALIPPLFYTLFTFYFLRSGFAHMGEKYIGVLADGPAPWNFQPYEKTGIQKAISLALKWVFGITGLGLFLWGLVAIGSWSMSGLLSQH